MSHRFKSAVQFQHHCNRERSSHKTTMKLVLARPACAALSCGRARWCLLDPIQTRRLVRLPTKTPPLEICPWITSFLPDGGSTSLPLHFADDATPDEFLFRDFTQVLCLFDPFIDCQAHPRQHFLILRISR